MSSRRYCYSSRSSSQPSRLCKPNEGANSMRNNNWKKRVVSVLAIGAASALTLTACGGGVSDGGDGDEGAESTEYVEATSGEVNLYTWSDYYPEELVKKFTEDTGITLNVDYFDSNESLEAKLRASDGAGYDVVVPSDYMVEILKNDGLLLKFDSST